MEYSRTLSKYLVRAKNENGYEIEVEREEVESMERPGYPYIKDMGGGVATDGRRCQIDLNTGRAWIFDVASNGWQVAHLDKATLKVYPITQEERGARRTVGGYNV